MTNLFTRIKNTITADLHEALDQKEKQNPIALLNQYLRNANRKQKKLESFWNVNIHLKDEFTREYHHATELAEKRKYQAEIASKAGETDLYQFAAAEHQQYSERAERLSSSLNKQMIN